MAQAAQDFLDRYGVPDVVIANAGVSVGTVASERKDLEAFRMVMDTNWFGVLTTFQPFLQPMRDRNPAPAAGAARWSALPAWRVCAGCRAAARTARPSRR